MAIIVLEETGQVQLSAPSSAEMDTRQYLKDVMMGLMMILDALQIAR